MSFEEAINHLENMKRYVGNLDWLRALGISIAALKKQIPKTILSHEFSYGQCPNCKAVYEDSEPDRYCGNCGQLLERNIENGRK